MKKKKRKRKESPRTKLKKELDDVTVKLPCGCRVGTESANPELRWTIAAVFHGDPKAANDEVVTTCSTRNCYEPTHITWHSKWMPELYGVSPSHKREILSLHAEGFTKTEIADWLLLPMNQIELVLGI